MAKKRKLTETYWAIRIGTFGNSEPHFLCDERGVALKFQTRADAFFYKRDSPCPSCDKLYWAIVRVDVTER